MQLRIKLCKWAFRCILKFKWKTAWQLLLFRFDIYAPNLEQYSCNQISAQTFWRQIANKCGQRITKQMKSSLSKINLNQDLISLLDSVQDKYDFYILSDCGTDKAKIILKNLPNLNFKKIIFSCDYKCSKRQGDLFYSFLQETNLQAAECLFLDDSKTNIKTAKTFGFQTFYFKNNQKIIQLLKSKLSA